MVEVSKLEEYKAFYQNILKFLPPNEGVEKPEVQSQPAKPKPKPTFNILPPPKAHSNQNKTKPKPKNVRPGFEGTKVIRKKRNQPKQ